MSDKVGSVLAVIGITSLLLWISVLIFGNYLIPVFYPSVVRAITFSIFAITCGYLAIASDNGEIPSYIFWTFIWVAFVMAVWRYGGEYYFKAFFWILFTVTSVIAFIIVWIVTKAERAAKAIKKEIVQFFNEVIEAIIDLFSIKSSVKIKCPEALKIQILEKKKHAVKVGIFGTNNQMIAKEEITSNEGVSEEVYKGQIIYC